MQKKTCMDIRDSTLLGLCCVRLLFARLAFFLAAAAALVVLHPIQHRVEFNV